MEYLLEWLFELSNWTYWIIIKCYWFPIRFETLLSNFPACLIVDHSWWIHTSFSSFCFEFTALLLSALNQFIDMAMDSFILRLCLARIIARAGYNKKDFIYCVFFCVLIRFIGQQSLAAWLRSICSVWLQSFMYPLFDCRRNRQKVEIT